MSGSSSRARWRWRGHPIRAWGLPLRICTRRPWKRHESPVKRQPCPAVPGSLLSRPHRPHADPPQQAWPGRH
eukprot:6006067-Alexandrium_andersonii.AAC.1